MVRGILAGLRQGYPAFLVFSVLFGKQVLRACRVLHFASFG